MNIFNLFSIKKWIAIYVWSNPSSPAWERCKSNYFESTVRLVRIQRLPSCRLVSLSTVRKPVCTTTSSSSSSSCRFISMDISDPLPSSLPIVHCFWLVFRATSGICTELFYVCSGWTFCLCSSLWRDPQEYITYELVPTSPAVSCMHGWSNFDSFRDRW